MAFVAQKKVMHFFRTGTITDNFQLDLFDNYDALVSEYISRYKEVVKFTGDMATELGYKFALTDEAVRTFDAIQQLDFQKLLDMKGNYSTELRRFALRSQLEGRSAVAAGEGFDKMFLDMGRRLNTEIHTGIANADAFLKKDFYTQAGIEKYVYLGPADDKTRDECQNTLGSDKQNTGWTMADIESSQTPFIQRGGWNCRHEWVAFTGEDYTLSEIEKKAMK